jgi:uncharacterized protein YgbK (DUF1537 family)
LTRNRLAIIADDLTGAMDSSGFLAARGSSASVVFDLGSVPDADIVAVSTESRRDSATEAAGKTRRAARALRARTIFKKIDSTLRGNVGAELAEIMAELGYGKAVVAPAFPAARRTTVNGVLLVDGVPVSDTPSAGGRATPITESHLPTLLEKSTGYSVGVVGLDVITLGGEAIRRHLLARSEDILVCDALEQGHLHAVAGAVASMERGWLLCGSGGVARELRPTSREEHQPPIDMPTQESGPALLVVGSLHEKTAEQLRMAESLRGIPLISPGIESAGEVLGRRRSIGITSTFDAHVEGEEAAVARSLADSAARAVEQIPVGLFRCGGDVAAEACRKLRVAEVRLIGEVEPGVPAGCIIGGPAHGMRVVTKAGGLGSPDAIVASLSYLEDGTLPATAGVGLR